MPTHQINKIADKYTCEICKWSWTINPQDDSCPGVPRYEFAQWPEDLYTYTQLSGMKLKPLDRDKPDGCYLIRKRPYVRYLYSKSAAVPKRAMSEKQQEAMRKAHEALRQKYTCVRCGHYDRSQGKGAYGVHIRQDGLCEDCNRLKVRQLKKASIAEWAHEYINAGEFIVLDSETTGLNLEAYDDEIIELAIISSSGEVLFSSPIQTQDPKRQDLATHIHGITSEELQSAPRFPELWPQIESILQKYPRVLVYNAAFDEDMMLTMCRLHDCKLPEGYWECLMEKYAVYHGAWNSKYRSYTWQKLAVACSCLNVEIQGEWHRATADAMNTLGLLKALADQRGKIELLPPYEPPQEYVPPAEIKQEINDWHPF